MKKLSRRIKNVPFSKVRDIYEKAKLFEQSGTPIVHMEIGRPNFDTPKSIKDEASQALRDGHVHYSSNRGVFKLRESISKKLKEENNIEVNPEREIVVTAGCKEAIFDTFLACLNPGDEVLIPEPWWASYPNIVKLLGAKPIPVPLKSENEFTLDPQEVQKRITPNSKMLVLCNPHNPTGSVLNSETIQSLAEICIRENLLVLSDEIYEKIIYDDTAHISIGSLPKMKERTVTINGFSKAYAMDGWRLGYAAGSEQIIDAILKSHQYTTACANTFAQYGAIEAYGNSKDSFREMVTEFNKRRKFLVEQLNSIPGVSCSNPKGTFYLFPSFHGYDMNSQELAMYLLQKAHVASVPGDVFGALGEGHIRISYSTDLANIQKGVENMRKALLQL